MIKRLLNRLMLLASALLLLWMPQTRLAAQGNVPEEVQKAQAMLQTKDYDGAIKILEDFTQRNPNRMGALNLLASAYQQKGELERALQAFQKVAQFPPLRPQAWYGIATIHALKNDGDGAFKYLQMLRETGSFDMSRILDDANLKGLRDDARFEKLIPKPAEFANPFVEKVKIIHE